MAVPEAAPGSAPRPRPKSGAAWHRILYCAPFHGKNRMKYTRPLLFCAILLSTHALQAQTKTDKAEVIWGPEQSMKDAGMLVERIGSVGNTAYLLMGKRDGWSIMRVDGTRVAWLKPLEREVNKHDLKIEKVLLAKDNIVVFASYVDKKEDKNKLYAAVYSKDDLATVKRYSPVASIPYEGARNAGSFIVSDSPDGSKILVQALPPLEKEANEKGRMEVLDADAGSVWSMDFELPYADDEFTVEEQEVDDDGSIMVLGVKYAEKRERRKLKRANKVDYTYHLLVYRQGSSAPEDHAIVVADKFLQDMTLSVGKTGDIIGGGLYGNKNDFNVRGAFYLRLDRASKAVVHESFKEFSDEFITSYMSEKDATKAKKKADKKEEQLELPEFDLHDIVLREDGGAVLLAEQYKMVVVTSSVPTSNGGSTTVTTFHYYYNDAIVVNIDPQGNIEWAVKVPKRQHSVNDNGMYSGFALEVKGDEIFIMFNDTGENLFLRPGDKVRQFELTGNDALVVLVTINANGEVSREALFSPERREAILRPRDCGQLEDKSLFIYASRKKDFRLGRVEFR